MELKCFLQIGESLFFRFTLAGDIDFQALGDIPLPLAPDSCGEWSLHDDILSHEDAPLLSQSVRIKEVLRDQPVDRAEIVAQYLLEAVLVGVRMVYRTDQSRGEHDFDLFYPDGRVSAVEVTSSVDEVGEGTNAAIRDKRKGGRAIKTRLCKNDWYITPDAGANINKVRAKADEYLAALESAGIERFFGPTGSHPTVERVYCELGIVNGTAFPRREPGTIWMAPPGGGGALNASTAIEAVEREAYKADNRKKLSAAGTAETHLVVYIYMTNYLPWCALTDFAPPPELPRLPPEITDIWACSETRSNGDFAAWRASALSPWHSLGRLHPPIVT
jgi:hypothetical protein